MFDVKTFGSPLSNPEHADKQASDYLANVHGRQEIINIRTTANDYYFYITIITKNIPR